MQDVKGFFKAIVRRMVREETFCSWSTEWFAAVCLPFLSFGLSLLLHIRIDMCILKTNEKAPWHHILKITNSIFFSSRFDNMLLPNHTQIKKKKLKKLLNMAVKTIMWYRLGHDECLKFQTRHSQSYQFQKDPHSLFYRKITGVQYKIKHCVRSNHPIPMNKTKNKHTQSKPKTNRNSPHTQYTIDTSKDLQFIFPHSQHFPSVW